ncbi:hypothetical protein [Cedecea lapagei]|uniref:hypothetical protein n=1 Tax=Cedecea lapagei TaxID=158823 RepID=UPI001BCD2E8F|nr:hypothetical protein [Cedecea lapagei]
MGTDLYPNDKYYQEELNEMNLLRVIQSPQLDTYQYEHGKTITVIKTQIVYHDHYHRVVLNRATGTFSEYHINKQQISTVPDLSKCDEAELFQYSTVMAIEPLKTIQENINQINQEYE